MDPDPAKFHRVPYIPHSVIRHVGFLRHFVIHPDPEPKKKSKIEIEIIIRTEILIDIALNTDMTERYRYV